MYYCSQSDKFDKLEIPMNSDDAISMRARLQYIATATRPDAVSFAQLLTAPLVHSKAGSSDQRTLRELHELVKYAKATANQALLSLSNVM